MKNVHTERMNVEEALRESEEKYRTLVERANDGIIIVQDGIVVFANPKMAELDASSVGEIVGTPYTDHVYPGEIPKLMDIYRRRLAGEEIRTPYETVLKRKNGDAAPSEVNAAVISYRGKPADMVIIRDISERKKTEEELRRRANEAEEGRRVMQTIVENIPEGIFIADGSDCRIRIASSYLSEMTGLPDGYFRGMTALDIGRKIGLRNTTVPRAGFKEYPIVRAAKYGETTINEEWQYTCPDERTITILINARPITDREGRIIGAVSAWRDITSRKRDEEILRRNEYEMKTLVDNSPDLIFRVNSDMRYVYANPAYERITGIPRERLVGSTNQELGMSQQLSEFWEYALRNVFENGREHALEFDMTSIFGLRYFSARLIPEFLKSGLVETVLVVARDTSERKRVEEHIRYLSFHDKVTGLFNRAYFEEEIARIDTERELPISIIMGDVNNLKLTNDVFGHQEGDGLLKAIAEALRKACRKDDIIARWGGDEYVVILPRTTLEVACEIGSRIKQVAKTMKGTRISPSISLGTAVKEDKEENIYQVIRQAEKQMYGNKIAESARNKENVFSSILGLARKQTNDLTFHIDRGRELARRFGRELRLDTDQMGGLLLLIEMHDIGQAVIPQEVLTKRGPLTEEEWKLVKRHPEVGFMILKSFPDTAMISNDVLCHDERWDGTGYPRGLKGAQIPFLARIFALIEAYDVMTHERPYARAFTRAEAINELRRNAGRQFDPELTEVFITKILRGS